MSSFIQADIFFFITSIAVVLLVILMAVLFVFLIKIMKDVRDVTRKFSEETTVILSDVHRLRNFMQEEGDKIKKFTEFISTIALARFMTTRAKKNAKKK